MTTPRKDWVARVRAVLETKDGIDVDGVLGGLTAYLDSKLIEDADMWLRRTRGERRSEDAAWSDIKYFDDVVVGEEYDFPGEYLLTQEDIVRVASEWDPQPFHVDEQAAAASMFGGLVASSVHLFSIAVKLAHTATEKRAAVSALGFDDVKVLRPARPGDRLRYRSCCIGKRESKSRPELGIVQARGELFNQDGEIVFTLTSAALFAKTPRSSSRQNE